MARSCQECKRLWQICSPPAGLLQRTSTLTSGWADLLSLQPPLYGCSLVRDTTAQNSGMQEQVGEGSTVGARWPSAHAVQRAQHAGAPLAPRGRQSLSWTPHLPARTTGSHIGSPVSEHR